MNEKIEQILEDKYPEYKKLPIVTDINADENPREDFWDDLTEHETYDVNAEFLRQTGNSEYNYLTCWEPGRLDDEKESLFDYPTFYEFDVAWWQYQKDARYESVNDYKKWMEEGSDHWTPEKVAKIINDLEDEYSKGYSIYCSGDWFRLIEDGVFIYAQVISAKWYMFYELENYISDLQNALLPYNLNDDLDFGVLLNEDDPEKKYKANGREKELDELQTLIHKYQATELITVIDTEIAKHSDLSGSTFRFDRGYEETETEKFDPFTDYIFWDEQSLKNVGTKTFVNDFKSHQKDNSNLNEIIVELKKKIESDFMEIYDANKSRYI